MKPATLNQLLFHPKCDTLSFFLPPLKRSSDPDETDEFINDMIIQLEVQGKTALQAVLDNERSYIAKIRKQQPEKGMGFFLAHDFQGYLVLETSVESFCIMGTSFHVRPVIEELFSNTEFMVLNVSLYDIKIYRGDFQHLEIIQHYEFDELPKGLEVASHARFYAPRSPGLVPYKTMLALKTLANIIKDTVLYQSLPVLVTGLQEMKKLFLSFFDHSSGIITQIQEDFYEKNCMEILERCKTFRHLVLDYYSGLLKDRLKRMMKSKLLLKDLSTIIKAVGEGRVDHLVLPSEMKIWGRLNFLTGEYEIFKKSSKGIGPVDILNELAEEVMKQGGRIDILRHHFFPEDAQALAIIRGRA